MKKLLQLIALLCFSAFGLNAQVYIDQSHTFGTVQDEEIQQSRIIGDYVYYTGLTNDAANFPTTNGSTPALIGAGNTGVAFYLKVNKSTGQLEAASLFAPNANGLEFRVANGKVYVSGWSSTDNTHPNFVNTVAGGPDMFFIELDEATGDLLHGQFIQGNDYDDSRILYVEGNYAYTLIYTSSTDLPVTDTSSYTANGNQMYLVQLNLTTKNIDYATYLPNPSSAYHDGATMYSDGNKLYYIYYTDNAASFVGINDINNFPNTSSGNYEGSVFGCIDLTTYLHDYVTSSPVGFTTTYYNNRQRYAQWENGFLYLTGTIDANAQPPYNATNGTQVPPGTNSANIPLYLKVDLSDGAIAASSYMGGTASSFPVNLILSGNEVIIAGATRSNDLPVTDGSSKAAAGTIEDVFYARIDKNNAALNALGYLGLIDATTENTLIAADANYLHFVTLADDAEPVNGGCPTGSSTLPELVYVKKDRTTGNTIFTGFLGGGGSQNEAPYDIALDSGYVYFSGETGSNDLNFPITTPGLPSVRGDEDAFLMRLGACDINHALPVDTLSPSVQNVCQFDFVEVIDAQPIIFSGDSLPMIYRAGVPEKQKDIVASYQWQEASSPTGPWTDIPAGILEDYLPSIGAGSQYFRRVSSIKVCGDGGFSSISDIASVLTNTNVAPTIDAGGAGNSCPGESVTLGATPTATGGASPYTYNWFWGADTVRFDSVANPIASQNASNIFTLIVTDANGCKSIDQGVLNIVELDAGADVSNCEGDSTSLLALGAPGLMGVSYAWTPSTGLNCDTCLQPSVLTNVVQTYTVAMTIPKTGGGTCTITDSTTVTPTNRPSTANFGGADQLICFPGSAQLGLPAEAGFSYTWSPGINLSSNDQAEVTYDPGSLTFPPTPDSAVYYVTAEQGGCVFYDTVVVDVIRAEAGAGGCGPSTLGGNTDVPTLNEQFIWTKISGDGNFIGATNIPNPTVTATTVGTSVYQLQTIYKGDTCTDIVNVAQCGCDLSISVDGEFGCPNANLGPVTLNAEASSLGSSVTYEWTPQIGLSNYNSASVNLTGLAPETYTVVARSTIDTSQFCSQTIFVNGPNMNLPVFTALDSTICPGDTVRIGAPTTAGYAYAWTPVSGVDSEDISAPLAYGPSNGTSNFAVRVEDVVTGCFIRDTSTITAIPVIADAGDDWEVCSNANIQLGTPEIAGYSYAWTPAAPWQNSTDSTNAQPEPLIATSLDFFVLVTDSVTGCTNRDTVSVIVNNAPTIPDYPDVAGCTSGTAQIGGNDPINGVTYSWSPTTDLSDPNILNPIATINGAQTYVLSAVFPGGCPPVLDTVEVTEDVFTFTLSDTTYCPSNGAFALGAGVPTGTGFTYSWSPAGLVSNATSANPNTTNPPPSTETDYVVTVTNDNGCVDTAARTITPTVVAAIAGADKTICVDATVDIGSADNTGGPGITYSWSPTTDLSCTTCAEPTFTPPSTGTFTYTLTRTDANLSCSSTDEITIRVNEFVIDPLPQPIICQNSSVQIGASPVGGATYVWSPAAGLSNPNIANPIASPTASTIYTLTAVGGNNCVAQQGVAVTVNATPPPIVTANPETICQSAGGGLMNATVSGGSGTYTYAWTPTTGLSNATVLNPSFIAGNVGSTIYTLSVTDANTGCDGSDTTLITIDDCLASIGNYVWNDLNEDGIQDSNEVGVGGVTVYLLNSSGIIIDSTVTLANGFYSFTDLTPTTYGIQFDLSTLPSGYVVSPQDAGSDDALDSDGSPIDGTTAFVTLTENENNTTLDLGVHNFVSRPNNLGDRVWNDLNNDGVQDAGEVGVAGITVTLYDENNDVIGTTVTDAYGNYLFTDLPDGDYSVGFTLPPNYVFTQSNTPGDNGDNTNSDVDPLTGVTSTYSLSGGETDLTADAGIYFEPAVIPASVGDYVWFDTNNDGVQDSSEVGISGVTVTLYDTAGNIVATTITDGDGAYLFNDVPPGDYTVGVTPPAGLGFSPNVGGVTDPNNSDVNPTTGQTAPFTVNPGDQITSVDAGLSPLPTTVGSLGDRVWYDTNQDGIQDPGEVGVSGVTVTLYASDGTTVLATTQTDAFGNYIFPNLAAGQYVVGFTTPAGFSMSPQGAGSDTTLNSDANPIGGQTAIIDLEAGQHNMTIDAGIYNSTPTNNNSIGDYVWLDANEDGIQDANENGVSGITVTLYDASNNPIGTTTTDANGYYLFPGLPNGDYSVGFDNLPPNFGFSPTGAGTSVTDSDPDPITGQTGTVSLTGGTNITDLDAGIYPGDDNIGTASLGDKVWYDVNGDGIQDPDELGVAGVTVYLYDSTGTNIIDSTTTDALGNYIFTGLTPDTYYVGFANTPSGFTFSPQDADNAGTNGASNSDVNPTTGLSNPIVLGAGEDNLNIDAGLVPPTGTAGLGDYVWYDLNGDGIQDANEPGVQGVQVSLLNSIGETIAVTTTDINGNYQFIGLAPGDYQVRFDNLPSGFDLTTQDADNTGLNGTGNSDADSNGLTNTITLVANQFNPNIDAGIVSTTVGSVGDYVWNDENGDGIQDPNEMGVGGVLVTLYDSTGNPVASTITNPDGSYIFTNLSPGDYTIGFDNLPNGMVFTQPNTGGNDSTDSDVDPITGRTPTFTVTGGSHNPTIDAGLSTPIPAGLGNYVWHDFNEDGIQDAGEPAVAGVIVTLYAADGTTVIAEAVTDGAGYYSFTNLPSGDYIVGFGNLPSGSTPTQSNGALNTTDNSDMDPTTFKTSLVTIVDGEFNPNLDAGIYFGVPLPVVLTDFGIAQEGCNAILSWTTASEENTSHFNVMRSLNNGTFEKIGEVAAAGNSSIELNYSFTDKNLEGRYLYKLDIIDIDRKTSHSSTEGLLVNCAALGQIKLYPNPVEDNLQVFSQLDQDDFYSVKLYDVTGRIVYETSREVTKGNDTFEVPMSNLASGSYLLEIEGDHLGKQGYKVQKQ